jgi:transcriptional regulator with XRE-family HTH domain
MGVSKKFREAVKLNHLKSYELAHLAGMHPSVLSRILNGIDLVRPGDPRVAKIAIVLGIPVDECFESSTADSFRNLGESERKQAK